MRHHTKDKGDIGVLKTQLDLTIQGWIISIPITEHAPFDLIATKDGISKTIQVKFRKVYKGGVEVNFRSCWSDKNGVHMKPVDKTAIDVMAIYCPETDECYYFDPKEFNKSVKFRVTETKNSNSATKFAKDYKHLQV